MYLTDVRLSNIACFDDISIDFTSRSKGGRAPWIVLIGENGTGKSTILQMIGAALVADSQIRVIAGDIDWRAFKRASSADNEFAEIWLSVASDAGDEGHISGYPPASVYISLRGPQLAWLPDYPSPGPRASASAISPMYSDKLTNGWFACGYSPWRRISRRSESADGAIPTIEDNAKPFRFASLFGDISGLTNVTEWLAGLYFQSTHRDGTDIDRQRFERARKALLAIMPGVKSLEVTKTSDIIVTDGKSKVPIQRLSDGYRGTLAWIVDLIRRLFDAYPDSANPLCERGVVLVDEIDLHLHPIWQRSIVQDCRRIFPKLQFIVTTHSPFIAQELRRSDCIVLLERNKGTGVVEARVDPAELDSWSANQIFGAYFGLSQGTRGKKTQREFRRFESLLDAEATGELTEKQRLEIEKLSLKLDGTPLIASSIVNTPARVAEAAVAALRHRRNAIEKANGSAPRDGSANGSGREEGH